MLAIDVDQDHFDKKIKLFESVIEDSFAREMPVHAGKKAKEKS